MNQEKFYIPRHLDDIPKFLLWDIDVALCFLVPFFFGFMISQTLIGLFCAFLATYYWKRVKGSGQQNFIRYLIYWYYPKSVLGLKATPDSSIRNYIG
ncbi:MAG: type IV conjugative transfer system protein TraL [Rickettsiales bacterium]|jgi:type IV conjugative transfer system protein TraL